MVQRLKQRVVLMRKSTDRHGSQPKNAYSSTKTWKFSKHNHTELHLIQTNRSSGLEYQNKQR